MRLARKSWVPGLIRGSAVGDIIWPAAPEKGLELFWKRTTLPVGLTLGTGEAFYILLHSLILSIRYGCVDTFCTCGLFGLWWECGCGSYESVDGRYQRQR